MFPFRPVTQRGITLVELLAVLGLLSVVVTLTYAIYHQMQELGQIASAMGDLLAEARLIETEIVGAMRKETVNRDALPGSSGSTPPVTFELPYASGKTARFSWNADHTFTVEREGETFTLSERVAAFSFAPLPGNAGYTFTLGLDGNGDGKADANDKHDLVTAFSVHFPTW